MGTILSLTLHIALIVFNIIALSTLMWIAGKVKTQFIDSVESGPKADVGGIVRKLLMRETKMEYLVDDALGNLGTYVKWDADEKHAVIVGPSENISLPIIAHEMGHARSFIERDSKGKRPIALDVRRSQLHLKIGTMSFYEYFAERDAWSRCGYSQYQQATLALRLYLLRAFVAIVDTSLLYQRPTSAITTSCFENACRMSRMRSLSFSPHPGQ